MSLISTQHNINPFTAGKSAALPEQRLAQIVFNQTKTMTKKGIKAQQSVCASIPMLAVLTAAQLAVAEPQVRKLIEAAQDSIIRELMIENPARTSIGDSDISFEACIEYLVSEASGNRLTKEKLGAWFDSVMVEPITGYVLEILVKTGRLAANQINEPLSEKNYAAINATIADQRDIFVSLAGGRTVLEPKISALVQKLLELVEEDDAGIGARLLKMLQKRNEPKVTAPRPDALDLSEI